MLAIPGAVALMLLVRLRRAVPNPSVYEYGEQALRKPREQAAVPKPKSDGFSRRFWLYAAFTAVSMFGFATFALLGYHAQTHNLLPAALIPVVYAAAMASAALAALASGWLYDRVGLAGLVVALPASAAVPFLSFSHTAALVWIGGIVWGAAMGVHESTLRAAVADLVPAHRRGAGYGTFTAVDGLAWLAGSTLIGALYEQSVTAVAIFTVICQALALLLLFPLLHRGNSAGGAQR